MVWRSAVDLMRQITQFVTEDPGQLGTQLSRFEDNVVKETESIRKNFALSATAIDDDPFSPFKSYTVGQCARINSAAGAVSFYLSAPLDKLPGEFIVVQKTGANGFVAIGVNANVNGAAKLTVASGVIVSRFYFDGTDYWS